VTAFNPSVNLCAQCHNDQGASWTISSAPPGKLPQYNMLLGTVGELDSGPSQYDPGSHALLITNQCVGCHMQTAPATSPSQPVMTGHTFAMDSYAVCAGCHGSAANASNLVVFVSGHVASQIQVLHASLNQWAITKAPSILGTAQYGTRAWEYTKPGSLSPGGLGPTANLQARIPVNIQKARFNLYLVLYDGSLSVHNPLYSLMLLDTAQNWVDQALQ
jgi:cytochrome c553